MIQYLQNNSIALITTAGLLGLIVGSFLNVVIYRLPKILDHHWRRQCIELIGANTDTAEAPDIPGLITPRSRCPHCGHQIRALENIPVVSFLFLRGKCAACGKPISRRYPLVELMSAAMSCVVVWQLGFGVTAAAALLVTWSLIALAFIDYDHQILPDIITLPVLWLGLVLNLSGMFTDINSAVLGAIAGYLSLWLVYHAFKKVTGKEGMGFGDFKLFAAFGAWLGWQALPMIILFASLVGAIVGIISILALGRDRNVPIPFGPYLAAAGWIALLWGRDIMRAYLQFSGITG